MTSYATIAALNVYPVKSCRGIALDRARLSATGLAGDRHWMVVSEAGRFLTQRELPALARVVPSLDENELVLTAPGMPKLTLPAESPGSRARVRVTIWRDECAALDEGETAAKWFSDFLGRAARLVRFDTTGVRPSDPRWTGDTPAFSEFADAFALLVTSQASLEDLNERLQTPVPMSRFRPSLVLDGIEPYEEDRIHELVDGEVRLRIVKPCTRCKITTTDQTTGEVMGAEPLKTLRSYRWSAELGGVLFGQNAIVVSGVGAELRVGQRLTIVHR